MIAMATQPVLIHMAHTSVRANQAFREVGKAAEMSMNAQK